MKKPSYRSAIEWIFLNDRPEGHSDTGHIATCLVADIFNVSSEKVLRDVFKPKRSSRVQSRVSTCDGCSRAKPVAIFDRVKSTDSTGNFKNGWRCRNCGSVRWRISAIK